MQKHKKKPLRNLFSTAALSIFCLSSLLFLTGCSEDSIQLGFVGGLTGAGSDLGGPARNGMLLAIEEANAQGGINGRRVETIIKDDKQDKNRAIQAVKDLIAQDVDAILGPVTSAMAVEVAGIASDAEKLIMGITVTTNDLSNKDDYFLRALAPSAIHAESLARYLVEVADLKRFAIVFDLRNKAYSKGWAEGFARTTESLEGQTTSMLSFSSGNQQELIEISEALLKGEPEMVIFVTNAVDAALLAKLVRSQNPEVAIGSGEWAGTERLIELGGRYIEGAYIPQYHDRESTDPAYRRFRDSYFKRFNHEPGFPGMIAYNATNIVLEGLRIQESDQSLKDAILKKAHFPSIQIDLRFNEYGDPNGKTYITRVIDGKFVVQQR